MEQSIMEPCNSKREFYKYLQEVKAMPLKDKLDVYFQTGGILFGVSTFIIILAILLTWFKSDVYAFIKNPKDSIEKFFKKDA